MTKQNKKIFVSHMFFYSFHYTLKQGVMLHDRLARVYYPINLHYSQTDEEIKVANHRFYYPINLHYSQTLVRIYEAVKKFYYSQTINCKPFSLHLFYYPINLRYSQTVHYGL